MNQPHGEETIFAEVLRLPPEQRAAYLGQATKGNPALRQRMEALLNSYEGGGFLEQGAASGLREMITLAPPVVEKPGDRIGHYKLLQQIGEGGCGVVYMAEQEEPVRRRVALKIIKLGMDTKQVIARFEAERQALAMMDHPNIAKVFDAGATETGRPYFVMELVRGLKITDYCDEKKLPTRQRLDLFIQVCQAIQHAHQKGIIHRDIKPSNILVTINDGVPVPKVIDFGIAKATSGQQLTDKTVFTAFEQFIGTPAYMSPEQAVMTSLDIDTRSDIYALGVLLYELLTGKTPFDARELLAIGLDEMRRTIREKEPERPSTRLSTLPGQELITTAQRRGLDAPKLVSQLRGDLDWIVMKSLEKDRARRYETASDLATDIQRHLSNEPVVACPPSNFYRFQKLFQRNKLAFSATAAILAALIFGLGTSTWMFLKEREARKRAVVAEEAERKLRQEAELRELNARALQLATQFNLEEAEIARRKALEVQRNLLGSEHPDVADSLRNLAKLLQRKHNLPEAEREMREALAIRRNTAPEGDLKTAEVLQDLAEVLREQDRQSETEELYRQAIKIRQRIQGDEHVDLALALNNLAVALDRQGKRAEAAPLYRQGLNSLRRLLGDGDPRVGLLVGNLVETLVELGNFSEAQTVAQDAIPPNLIASPKLTIYVKQLVKALSAQHQFDNADKLLTDILSVAPDNFELLTQRAELRARFSRFQEASADCARLLELKPDDETPWHFQITLLAYTGQIDEYRRLSQNCLYRFEKSDNRVRERAAKDALLLPQSGPVLDDSIRVADRLPLTNLNTNVKTWFHFLKGLADYRARRFESALEQMEVVLQSSNSSYYGDREAQARSIIAMAQFELGHIAEAKKELEYLTTVEKTKLATSEKGDLGIYGWDNWLRALILIRQARSLIDGSAKTISHNE